MQSTNLPSKFLVPFATNDSARVEVPVTTSAVGRASQSLGFPPITGQPPEAGGQPPQLEDFNGALNQASRVAWWSMLGGLWAYDATFATDTNINGYPNGAVLASADRTSAWLSQTDNNTANPDTVGTNWAPAWAYGASALSGLTGGTMTLTPAQAMKRRVTLGGALTSNLVVVVPAWVYNWTFVNTTTGAFTVTVKTASGSGAVVPQNGAPTPLLGDGTNISAPANNVPAATTSTQAMQLGQATGRLVASTLYTANATWTPNALTKAIRVRMCGGGGAGGSAPVNGASTASTGGGGGAGSYLEAFFTSGIASPQAVAVGSGGTFNAGGTGGTGGTSSLGALATAPGGLGGVTGQTSTTTAFALYGGGGAGGLATVSGAVWSILNFGQAGGVGTIYSGAPVGGYGASGPFGSGPQTGTGTNGSAGSGYGAGGSGGSNGPSGAAVKTGGNGTGGCVIIEEYC